MMWPCRTLGRLDITTHGFLSICSKLGAVVPAAGAYAAIPDGVPAKQGQI